MQACETPLVELLRIPRDARLIYEHNSTSHSFIPVGRLCNEAADEIERLRTELAEVKRDAERYLWLRRKVCIIQRTGFMSGDRYAAFEILDMPYPTYAAPRADIEFDAAIDAAMAGGEKC